MVWACPLLALGSGYSGVPSAFGRPLRAPSIPHEGHGKLIKVEIIYNIEALEKNTLYYIVNSRSMA